MYDLQELQRARLAAPAGSLLSPETADGPYGDRFWSSVAEAVPGRTAAECLDVYLAVHRSPVARFSATTTASPRDGIGSGKPSWKRRL